MAGLGSGHDGLPIACDIVHGIQRWYVLGTQESYSVPAPVTFYDDFMGVVGGDARAGGNWWNVVEVNLNTAIDQIADQPAGILGLLIDGDNNAEDAVLYWGDQRGVNLYQHANIEMGLAFHVIPTGGAPATGVTAVFGLAHDHNLDKDTIATSVWFRLQGSADLLCESDDTTGAHENDDVDTGIDLILDQYHVFRIDCFDMTDVRFFVDGHRVCAATTFDMSNCTADEATMQPYFSLDKAANVEVGEMYPDYVRIWTARNNYVGP